MSNCQSIITRVGQNHIYTVYIRYWLRNHQIYGIYIYVYIRFWPTLIITDTVHLISPLISTCMCARTGTGSNMHACAYTHMYTHPHTRTDTTCMHYTHTHAYAHTHTRTHTHSHLHTPAHTGVEDYIHRIGRTGRAGAQGESHTFMTSEDAKHARKLSQVCMCACVRVCGCVCMCFCDYMNPCTLEITQAVDTQGQRPCHRAGTRCLGSHTQSTEEVRARAVTARALDMEGQENVTGQGLDV